MNDMCLPSEDLIAHVKANTELFRMKDKMMEVSPFYKEAIEKLNRTLGMERGDIYEKLSKTNHG